MKNYMYILVMAVTTYLIRVIPLTLLRKEIKNRTFRSFLTYVPYVTLSVMTFPAILESTDEMWVSLIGFGAAMVIKSVCLLFLWGVVCWYFCCRLCNGDD